MGRLEGKVALITGSGRGIGKAFAERYVKEGAKVVIADINFDSAQSTASQIDTAKAIAIHLDVTNQDSIDKCVKEVVKQFGRIDILINNAAIFDLAPITEITRENYERVFAVNAVAKQMIAHGKGGKIINMASQAGRKGESLMSVYCASKAAVISFTQSAGLNLIKHRINVNAISPGVVDGQLWDYVDSLYAKYEGRALGETTRLVGEAVPYGRMGKASDLIGMAVFLASDEADYIVGQTYNVDGGMSMN